MATRFDIPMQVRLTLDHMRAQIVHVFSEIDLGRDVDEAVRRAIEDFDFDSEIAAIAHGEIRSILHDALRRELQRMAWTDKTFREELAAVVTRAFKRAE